MSFKTFRSQTWALIKKNLIIICVRSWFTTLLRYLAPIAFITVLWHIPSFIQDDNRYGMGSSASVGSLGDAIGKGKLVLVKDGTDSAPDLQRVLDTLTKPLGNTTIVYLNSTEEKDVLDGLDVECPVDDSGAAPCFGAVVFHDSPLAPGGMDWWKYDIRASPDRFAERFDSQKHSDPMDLLFLPLQAAVENAITNTTEQPVVVKYTLVGSQEDATYKRRQDFLKTVEKLMLYFLFISAAFAVQHVSAMVAKDRDAGLSDLIDSMSGGAAWARVASYIVTFDIVYLPLWIILGCLNWAFLLPDVSLAIVLFWQILGGFAVISGAVFGTAFFKRAQAASIAVVLFSFFLGVGGAVQHSVDPKSGFQQFVICGLLLPPMAWIFLFGYLLTGQRVLAGVDMTQALPKAGRYALATTWTTEIPCIIFFAFFIAHIFSYAALAAVVETYLHGKRNRQADFDPTPEGGHVAVRATGLVKHYRPSFSSCWRGGRVKAVNGLDLESHKNQVLCLLGPNGSGKTTTMDMLAGAHAPTAGTIQLKALPTQLGVCPQKNALWSKLTVYEHLVIWNTLKGSVEDKAGIDKLIEKCDLSLKRNCQAGTLSGGMKRKLQLACMLIGGSSICLLDEVTSGLDPLSRRAIWNVILSERSHRTMILTTHFLDEAEVLADHIVILSHGNIKCSGTPAQLKSQYGGGYRVSFPETVNISKLEYPVTPKDDRYICTVPDSKEAVRLLSSFRDLGSAHATVTGPTIEDVFLHVSDQSGLKQLDSRADPGEQLTASSSHIDSPLMDRQPAGRARSFFIQSRALLLKRFVVLRSQWWIYLFAIAIPVVISYYLAPSLAYYETPECGKRLPSHPETYPYTDYVQLKGMIIGPESANKSIHDVFVANQNWYWSEWAPAVPVRNNLSSLVSAIEAGPSDFYSGGMWVPGDDDPTAIFVPMDYWTPYLGMAILNSANQARSGINITGSVGTLRDYGPAGSGKAIFYIIIVCLLQTLYPAFFSVYPAYERRSQVRALQYSNGVRPAALLTAYLMFDFIFVMVITAGCTALMNFHAPWWHIQYVAIVMALYGLAATLFVYLVSRAARSQPGAFIMSFLLSAIMYCVSIICITVVNNGKRNRNVIDGVGFGLGAILPIQNVFRALELGLNSNSIRCRPDGFLNDPRSIYAFLGPIILLVWHIVILYSLLLCIEGAKLTWLTRHRTRKIRCNGEQGFTAGRTDVDAEKLRVLSSDDDLLRLINVSKMFGNNLAVDDVSFGLRRGEIMALLGPNGAGKTTTINMIRGDLAPDNGHIYLERVDTHTNTRRAQGHLGLCPQFDALDMLTVREHLVFYARCKNVPDIEGQVIKVMDLVGIAPHAGKMAAKLSGGNKRKLSLAIALLGNPPVLILDEPSSAMDAISKRILWKTLRAVSPGRSVLITTHSMEEADALSTRSAIIAKRILAIGSVRQLREAFSNEYHIHLVLRSSPTSSKEEMEGVASWVRDTFGSLVQMDGESLGGQVRFIVPVDSPVMPDAMTGASGQSFVHHMIDAIENNKDALGIDCFSINTATMERVFLGVMKNSDMDEAASAVRRKWWHF